MNLQHSDLPQYFPYISS